MSYKFRVAYKKGNKHLLKIDIGDGDDKWMNTTEAVYNYAKSSFEEGDDIGLEYEKKGKIYHVSRVNKDGKVVEKSASEKVESEPTETSKSEDKQPEYTCSDCGKELKDGKYDKCYTCNQKNPSKGKYSQKSPEVQDSIKTQSAYKVAAQALSVFTGQIADLGALKEQLDDLANHIKNKF